MEVTTMEDTTMEDTTWDMSGFGASPDGLGLSVGLADPQPVVAMEGDGFKRALKVAYALAGMAGSAIGAYHGYKRNDSLGWAIGWAFLGGLFPVIAIPVAFAQGFGERK